MAKRWLRRLGALHREIMYRLLAGQMQCDIADELEMHPASVSRIANDPLFQPVLRKVEKDTGRKIGDIHGEPADTADAALESLQQMLGDERVSARVRFRIAKLVLDAAGLREG